MSICSPMAFVSIRKRRIEEPAHAFFVINDKNAVFNLALGFGWHSKSY